MSVEREQRPFAARISSPHDLIREFQHYLDKHWNLVQLDPTTTIAPRYRLPINISDERKAHISEIRLASDQVLITIDDILMRAGILLCLTFEQHLEDRTVLEELIDGEEVVEMSEEDFLLGRELMIYHLEWRSQKENEFKNADRQARRAALRSRKTE